MKPILRLSVYRFGSIWFVCVCVAFFRGGFCFSFGFVFFSFFCFRNLAHLFVEQRNTNNDLCTAIPKLNEWNEQQKYERMNEWTEHIYTYLRYSCARESELVHLCIGFIFVDVNNWTSMWVDSFSLTLWMHIAYIVYIWNDFKVSMYLGSVYGGFLCVRVCVLNESTKCLCWLWRYSELLALKKMGI